MQMAVGLSGDGQENEEEAFVGTYAIDPDGSFHISHDSQTDHGIHQRHN